MENRMDFSQKTKNRITVWPSNSTPVYIFGKTKNTDLKRYMPLKVPISIIYSCQDKEATCVHQYTNGILKKKPQKEWISAICNKIDGSEGYCAKWNMSDKEKQIYAVT